MFCSVAHTLVKFTTSLSSVNLEILYIILFYMLIDGHLIL